MIKRENDEAKKEPISQMDNDPFDLSWQNLKQSITDGSHQLKIVAVNRTTGNTTDHEYHAIELKLQALSGNFEQFSVKIFVDNRTDDTPFGLMLRALQAYCEPKGIQVPNLDQLVGSTLFGEVSKVGNYRQLQVIKFNSFSRLDGGKNDDK
ncbi:hypothetical protein ATO00_13145 [Loigolactobacillus coryniformis subsp. coryniformis]|jgi:hypothetical protein|uniref:DUF669 domain-containing protein n=1 Tax=Loigolactobacillus coryniformis subsp. coryniformis KCTC 3167 = DSM 20001 TaxID=913848 RepID=A0A0R1F4F4_9LACO|nr:hypothetical protein [Loigolactobacillus coryniformis]ATO56140.1 hypothetical protein LC20001_11145 [Loigolactobacillus coryniformis subsp. coryniformis KCTC 3167 = DSM 20001]KRK16703.1 hypothetical protein FD22_GL001106 [Loigolactobacillus coryniformis subsp. coryniformis KCTC 3167 = DSM 20001]MCL5458943.1 hypothetical protein [Loigolactobacillus coryniformis]OEH89161.1 hypothetical protein ATO00_13145 [Loigolactobacillus coryniformis subsp. coryniformis]